MPRDEDDKTHPDFRLPRDDDALDTQPKLPMGAPSEPTIRQKLPAALRRTPPPRKPPTPPPLPPIRARAASVPPVAPPAAAPPPAPVAVAVTVALSAPLAAPAPEPTAPAASAAAVAPTPGWVVGYLFTCVLLTILGVFVLAWWKAHGLW